MGNREERNEYATAKWDAEEVRRQASSEQRRHSDRRRQAKRNRTIIYLACVVLVSCLLAGIGWLLVNDVCSLNKPYTEVEITVEEGDSRGDVAKKLHDAGLVNSRLVFNIAGTFLHYNRYVEPGTYKLNSDMDFRALITNMHDWETDAKEAQGLIKVTIPEGYTVREIIDLLAEKGVATKEDLEDACANFAYEDCSPAPMNSTRTGPRCIRWRRCWCTSKTASASRCWRTSRRLRTPCRRSSPWHP